MSNGYYTLSDSCSFISHNGLIVYLKYPWIDKWVIPDNREVNVSIISKDINNAESKLSIEEKEKRAQNIRKYALNQASMCGHFETIKYLINSVSLVEKKKAFIWACLKQNFIIAKYLLNLYGQSLLIDTDMLSKMDREIGDACLSGRFETIRLFMKYGANINIEHSPYYTDKSLMSIKYLISQGLEIPKDIKILLKEKSRNLVSYLNLSDKKKEIALRFVKSVYIKDLMKKL